jgi:CBS domain-containing protein
MELGRIVQILCDYRRQQLIPEQIEVVPDLQIIDLYAARVAGESEYLVHVAAGTVEEVNFAEWPPLRHVAEATSQTYERNTTMRIEQLMSPEVHHCGPRDTLDRAARLMWDHDCGCLPVCAGDGSKSVVGMITDRDICMAALLEGQPLNGLRVVEVMSREICACSPVETPAQVERKMRDRQIRRVPVVDDGGRLVGIVSLADLARAARPGGASTRATGISETEITGTLAAICEPPANRTTA